MRKLHNSKDNRIIAGVCGGIAETYDIDVSLIRVMFIVVSLFYGTGIVVYLAMMMILPDKEEVESISDNHQNPVFNKLYRIRDGKMIAGICSGLADILKTDVSILRVLLICITIFSSGIPVVLYLLLWIILPYQD